MTRAVSLTLAIASSGVLFTAPFLLVRQMTGTAHGLAALMLLGLAGAFVHGVGFEPRSFLLRQLFSPAIAWPLLIGPAALLLAS